MSEFYPQRTVEVCNYAAQQIKRFPTKSLDGIKETILYEKKAVVLTGNRDRRLNKIDTPADRTNANLSGRVTDFHGSLKNIYILQNSVRFICISRFSKLST